MRTAIIIPARLASTRLANKLLLDETGEALICHTVLAAARIRDASGGLFPEVTVAADSPAIIGAVERFSASRGLGVGTTLTDPGHRSGSDRIAEAAAALPAGIDSILNLQGDEPEIEPEAVLGLAETFASARPDIATLVYPADPEERANPDLVKAVIGRDGRALYFSRADIPHRRSASPGLPSYGHIGIYLYRRESLERFVALPPGELEQAEKLEQLRALENGMTIVARVLPHRPPKGIDTPEDYAAFVRRTRARGPDTLDAISF